MKTSRMGSLCSMATVLFALCSPLAGQKLLATIPIPDGPAAIAVNPLTNKAYVVTGNQSVSVINGATNSVDTTLKLPSNGSLIALNVSKNKIYVVNGAFNYNMSVIDGATNTVVTVEIPGTPWLMAADWTASRIYTLDTSGFMSVFDANSNTVLTWFYVPQSPQAIAVNPVTNKIYVSSSKYPDPSIVTIIDGTNYTMSTVQVGSDAKNMVVNSVTNKIYALDTTRGAVWVIDGATHDTTAIDIYGLPIQMALDSVTNKIFVADEWGNVYVVDGANNSVTTIPGIPEDQYAIVADALNHEVYVTGQLPRVLSAIDGLSYLASSTDIIDGPTVLDVNPVTGRVFTVQPFAYNVNVFAGLQRLTVQKDGSGTGLAAGGNGNIYCGPTCTYSFQPDTLTEVTAMPGPGCTFSGWTGCDSAHGSICALTVSSPRQVKATFDITQVPLTSLKLNPMVVKGGKNSAATVSLGAPAPAGGLGIAITTNSMVVHLPALVVVPGGRTAVSFSVHTFPVHKKMVATITALANSSQVSADLTVDTH